MTLLLVGALSAVAVAMSDSLRMTARRAANAQAHEQASWYLLGAEELVRQALRRELAASPDRTTLDAPWAKGPVVFPIDEGRIEGLVTDRSNCFNLNSLVTQDHQKGYVVNPDARDELVALAVAVGVDPGEAAQLAAVAADWIDSDDAPGQGGAEDFEYSTLSPPYRAANTLFGEVEEARALKGVGEKLFLALRPTLCAYPSTTPAKLNANTMQAEDAPVLAALFKGALTVEAARDVIAERPAGGWAKLDDFWATGQLSTIKVDSSARGRIVLASTFFQLSARVYYSGAYAESESLLAQSSGGVSVVRRRLGAAD
jgi:general secretion pathway protein K